jgi:hypothetical protein
MRTSIRAAQQLQQQRHPQSAEQHKQFGWSAAERLVGSRARQSAAIVSIQQQQLQQQQLQQQQRR